MPNLTYVPTAGYVGTDSATFTVTDAYGASATGTLSFTVKDKVAPVITLNGANPMSINQGSTFTDPGATALDAVDGSVPVSSSGTVNTSVPGPYVLTYTATDAAGNSASKTRTVNVVAVNTPKLVIEQLEIKRAGVNAQVKFVVHNVSSQNAVGVSLTGASLGGVASNQPMPKSLGNIAAGATTQVTLIFRVPAGSHSLALSGLSALGSFGLTQTVYVP